MSSSRQRETLVRAEIRAIGCAVAAAAGLTEPELFGRSSRHAWARQLAMWLAGKTTGASYAAIGRAFDRDHTTVLYAVDKIDAAFATEGPQALVHFLAFVERQTVECQRRLEVCRNAAASPIVDTPPSRADEEVAFYGAPDGTRRTRRSYLEQQNRRMLEALAAAAVEGAR